MTITDEQITAAARALSNDNADVCNVNREDNWNFYGDSFRETAKVALEAAMGVATAVDAGSRYIVIGYGETDNPQAAFANKREELLDAVLGMMYTHPSDADAEIREAYRKDLDDEDEWTNDGIWCTEFEIGGIVIYDTGERVGNSAALSASTEAAAGEPVAQVDENDDGLFIEILYGANGSALKRGDKLYTAPPAASGQKLTDEQIAALRVAADALIERYAEPIRAILRNAERVDGLTVQGLRTLMMRHAKSYSEWDCGSLERVDFGQYGFDEFARALLRASDSATASDKEGA